MMSDAPHTTVSLLFQNMIKTYLPPVDQDGFDAVYSTEKIARIHKAFATAIGLSSGKKDDRTKEKIVSQAWVRDLTVSVWPRSQRSITVARRPPEGDALSRLSAEYLRDKSIRD